MASLEALEATISRDDLVLFQRKRRFGHDLDDPIFTAWCSLKNGVESTQAALDSQNLNTLRLEGNTEEVLNSVIDFPECQRKVPVRKKLSYQNILHCQRQWKY